MFDIANAKLGQTVETPWGPLVICGIGGVPVNTVTFSASGSYGSYGKEKDMKTYSVKSGWEDYEMRKARLWTEEFEALDQASQEVLGRALGDRLNDPDRWKNLKMPARLVSICVNRLMRENDLDARTCGRCGGSGRFSYNQIDGDRCYGCNGRKFLLLTPKMLLAELKKKEKKAS